MRLNFHLINQKGFGSQFDMSGTALTFNLQLLKFHPLIWKISAQGIHDLLKFSNLVKIKKNEVLYLEQKPDKHRSVYIILTGRMSLHQEKYGTICQLWHQHCLGEETLSSFQNPIISTPKSKKIHLFSSGIPQSNSRKHESAYALEDSLLLEIFDYKLRNLQQYLTHVGNTQDWQFIQKFIEFNYYLKQQWR